MLLPIDARDAPFRDKYIDEETPLFRLWFRFYNPDADGTVSLSDNTADNIFEGLAPQQAQRLIAARDVFVQTVLDILNKEPLRHFTQTERRS